MSEDQSAPGIQVEHADVEHDADVKADVTAILIIFGAALLFAVHFISGFTFDL